MGKVGARERSNKEKRVTLAREISATTVYSLKVLVPMKWKSDWPVGKQSHTHKCVCLSVCVWLLVHLSVCVCVCALSACTHPCR